MKKIVSLSILLFFGIVGYSQKIVSVSNPLEEYFQKNYDSTIFLYQSNNIEPFIYIMSKKGNKLYNYRYIYSTYEDLIINKYELGPLDNELKEVFTNRLEIFKKTKPSINQYFTYYNTDSVSNIKIRKESYYGRKDEVNEIYSPLWVILQNFDLWSLRDESNEELNKYDNSNVNDSKDVFVLITKGQVKKLKYRELDSPSKEKDELRKKVSEIKEKIWLSLTRIN